jgi:hypothetical protein
MIVIFIHKYKAAKKVQVLTKLEVNFQKFDDGEISGGS